MDRTIAPNVSLFSEIALQPQEVFSLENGTRVHLVRKGSLPLSRVAILWDGGNLDYPSQAIVGVTGATLTEGTKSMSSGEVADIVDYSGARLAGGVCGHYLSLELMAINSTRRKMVELMADIASNASFPSNAVESARRRIAASRALQMEKVAYKAASALEEIMHGAGHPASAVAKPGEFMNVTDEDCRTLFARASRAPMNIFAGGDLSDNFIETIVDTFEAFPVASESPIHIRPYSPMEPVRKHIAVEGAVQSAVAIGMPEIGRDHPDYIPLRLAIMALGGYFGSRLMANIREEKGLTYGISAALLGSLEGAFMEIQAQCDARYVDQVIEETLKEIKRLASCPPMGRELDRLRLHAWTSLAQSADNVFSTLDHYITSLRVGTPSDYFERQLQAIATLTSDTIARVAAEYLDPDKLSIVTAGESPR